MDDDELYAVRDRSWRVLPRWAKGISLFVGLPAWLVFMFAVFSGNRDTHLMLAAFAIFAGVAILQLVLIFRAEWRTEA